MKMKAYVESAQSSAMADVNGWRFEIANLDVYVTFWHRRKPQSAYLLKVSFDDFPKRAPSYVFVDLHSKQMTSSSWPPNTKHGNPPPGICTPGTREFHEHFHKNDAQYPWSEANYTFLDTLKRIQRIVDEG